MKSKSKKFHIGDVLAITTGREASLSGDRGIMNILEFMWGRKMKGEVEFYFSVHIGKFSLLQEYPQLEKVDTSSLNKRNLKEWLVKQEKRFGKYLVVPQITSETRNRYFKPPLVL